MVRCSIPGSKCNPSVHLVAPCSPHQLPLRMGQVPSCTPQNCEPGCDAPCDRSGCHAPFLHKSVSSGEQFAPEDDSMYILEYRDFTQNADKVSQITRHASRASQVDRASIKRKDDYAKHRQEQVMRSFPKRPLMCKLSQKAWDKLLNLYIKMDADGCNAVKRDTALAFFSTYKNVNVEAMFNEVDVDKSGAITSEEFMDFWMQVRSSGYSEELILEEVEQIMEGGSWVDWKDGRDPQSNKGQVAFPKRPILCRLSRRGWKRLEELFMRMSGGRMTISRSTAMMFFQGSFSSVSTNAMFNEIDIHNHGCITAQEFMQFWLQVRAHGYRENVILDEVEELLSGGAWVDWRDSRHT